MKIFLLLIPICIGLSIFFYPTTSNSFSTGSPGGKTGSPTDGSSCTGCHYAGVKDSAMIITNIPLSGYVPNQTYTITANISQHTIQKFGFEITAEETNFGSAKAGSFLVTDALATKFVNNNTAITHTAGGTFGSQSRSWSMDWVAPNTGTGAVTFFGAFMATNGDGSNSGDTYHSATLTFNEGFSASINDLSAKNDFRFNTVNKTIKTKATVNVYDINGKLVLTTNSSSTHLSHLKAGTYILTSAKMTQRIILN